MYISHYIVMSVVIIILFAYSVYIHVYIISTYIMVVQYYQYIASCQAVSMSGACLCARACMRVTEEIKSGVGGSMVHIK